MLCFSPSASVSVYAVKIFCGQPRVPETPLRTKPVATYVKRSAITTIIATTAVTIFFFFVSIVIFTVT